MIRTRTAGASRRRHAADAARRPRRAGAGDRGFVESLRARDRRPGRDVRRAIHERAGATATTRRRRLTCFPVTSSGRAAFAREAAARASSRRVALALAACSGYREEAADRPGGRAASAAEAAAASSFPRGSRGATWRSASRPSTRSPCGSGTCTRGCRHASYLRATDGKVRVAGFRNEAVSVRGLPLPGDVRLLQEDDVEAARGRPARRVPEELGAREPQVRSEEEPDAVRRADDRVDDREGGAGSARAEARRGGDLQPPPPRHAAAGSTRRSATGSTFRRPSRSTSRSSTTRPRTTRASTRACRRRRSPTRAWRRSQAAAHPAKVDYLYYVRKPDHVHHFFTASDVEFENYLAAHGYG